MSKQQYSRRFQVMEYTSDTEKRALTPEMPTFFEGVTAALASRPVCTHFNVHFSGLRLREVRDGEAMPAKWCRIEDDGSGAPWVSVVHDELAAPTTAPTVAITDELEAARQMKELEEQAELKSKQSLAKLAPKRKKRKRA